jgi:hypothetical protein
VLLGAVDVAIGDAAGGDKPVHDDLDREGGWIRERRFRSFRPAIGASGRVRFAGGGLEGAVVGRLVVEQQIES